MLHKWEQTFSGRDQGSFEASYCGKRFPIVWNEPTHTRMRWESVTCRECWERKHKEELEKLKE